MRDCFFRKVIALGVVFGLFAVASGLFKNGQMRSISSSAYAAEAISKESDVRLTFENVPCLHADGIRRAKVAGGWLVMLRENSSRPGNTSASITFYPDPQHLWDGGSVK
jgi:hypothetical protein